jgi:hypothetical protein
MMLPITDSDLNGMLVEALETVLPDVWEGVYTGDDLDKYLTFVHYSRGVVYANDRPTAKTWRVTVTLWARNRVNADTEREAVRMAIWREFGEYAVCETATDDGWQQYIYEFTAVGGVEAEVYGG